MDTRNRQFPPAGLPKVIDIYQPGACALWAQRLGTTEEGLIEAVRLVGVELDAVRLYLGQFRSVRS